MEPKKNPKIDLGRKSGMFFNIGLCTTLLLTIFAFEYKSYDEFEIVELGQPEADFEELVEIPQTAQPPPPPPKVKLPEIIEIPDEEEIEEEIEVELDVEVTEETVVEEIVFEEAPAEESADEIFTIVEENASFPGGLKAFAKYLRKNIKYPGQAKRIGVEGKVFVQFIVETDGTLTDIKVVKGIGAGCDEEAVRIIRKSPRWNPGKQRGRAVRQKMVQFISFKLN